MTAPVLKKLLGEAGAGLDDSSGQPSTLREVLVNMVKAGVPIAAHQITIATAILIRHVVQFDGVIGDLGLTVDDTGSAGSTQVVVNKNGTVLATTPVAVDNTDADGISSSTDLSGDPAAAFVKGDIIDIEVTVAPTAGVDLDVNLSLRPASIEA